MRFVDTNIFIGYLVEPSTDVEQKRSLACRALIDRVRLGQEEIATSEAAVAEVIYVLTSPRIFRVERTEVVARLRPILMMTGLRLANKGVCLSALDMFATNPFLDFADALLAAYTGRLELAELYSFDSDFDRLASVVRVEPPLPEG